MIVPGLLDGARVKSAHVVMSSVALHRSPPAAEYGATKGGKASRAARRHDERATAPRTSRGFQEPAFVDACNRRRPVHNGRSEEHTSELQSLMRISYAVFCLKKKKKQNQTHKQTH